MLRTNTSEAVFITAAAAERAATLAANGMPAVRKASVVPKTRRGEMLGYVVLMHPKARHQNARTLTDEEFESLDCRSAS